MAKHNKKMWKFNPSIIVTNTTRENCDKPISACIVVHSVQTTT